MNPVQPNCPQFRFRESLTRMITSPGHGVVDRFPVEKISRFPRVPEFLTFFCTEKNKDIDIYFFLTSHLALAGIYCTPAMYIF